MRVGGRLLRILFVMTIVFTVWTYSISAAEEKQPEKNGDIVILYTSDVHCAVDQGFGYAGLQQVRDYLLSQGNEVILVDDGDSIRGDVNGAITKGDAIMKFNGDYFSDPGENLSSRREISDRLFFHRCSTAVPPLRRGTCCGTKSGTHGIHFLWVLFYDTACVMNFSPLRRTRAGRGQRAAGPPLPYCTWCDEKKRDRGLRVCARVCAAFLFLFHEID